MRDLGRFGVLTNVVDVCYEQWIATATKSAPQWRAQAKTWRPRRRILRRALARGGGMSGAGGRNMMIRWASVRIEFVALNRFALIRRREKTGSMFLLIGMNCDDDMVSI
jgi:hypothetical protein